MDQSQRIILPKYSVVCRENDQEADLYLITSGTLLICSREGSRVTPLAYVNEGEYFGELSFFDKLPRSADVITLEKTEMIKFESAVLESQFPKWLTIIIKKMTKKIRIYNNVINTKGLRRKDVKTIAPLEIEEQREILKILEKEI